MPRDHQPSGAWRGQNRYKPYEQQNRRQNYEPDRRQNYDVSRHQDRRQTYNGNQQQLPPQTSYPGNNRRSFQPPPTFQSPPNRQSGFLFNPDPNFNIPGGGLQDFMSMMPPLIPPPPIPPMFGNRSL